MSNPVVTGMASEDIDITQLAPMIGLPIHLSVDDASGFLIQGAYEVAGQLQAVVLEDSALKFVFYGREFSVPFGQEYSLRAF